MIDTSALIAMLRDEPSADALRHAVAEDGVRLISTVSVLEATCVMTSRGGPAALMELTMFLAEFRFEQVAFMGEQLAIAQKAWLRYGKGRHRAGLNFGDCASYALAEATGEALLFVGEDFPRTGIRTVMG
ncbi:MAG TPA: type II toxin-antitoxin system VapC family toxin [Bryobacteraceae bacterium]|nr:type II toxin-antitoxin system VapC family toxin [Bryobacteraceae bacterium]